MSRPHTMSRAQMGLGTAVVLVPDPATAVPFQLLGDLALPHRTQALRSGQLPAFGRLSSGPQLGGTERRLAHAALRLAR
jgi:hypothetical protein